jgi:myosin heavy subunit
VLEGIRICMRGFPNRMMYPEFKLRYAILAAEELASSQDNKEAVWACMDKIEFSRERYRLGHTIIFFRAGALAGLEETRDNVVIKLVRKIQGEVLLRVRKRVYAQKAQQRELIKVCQRNFQKFLFVRDWGWFILVQATRPMIGRLDPNEELAKLEAKAAATYDVYKAKVDRRIELLEENKEIEAEKKDLMKTIEKEQGNLSQYHDRQAAAAAAKVILDKKLGEQNTILERTEKDRLAATENKKMLEQETIAVKKDIGDIDIAIQKLETEKSAKDHTIKTVNDEIADQDEIINKLNKEKKYLGENNAKSAEDMQVATERQEHMTRIKSKLESTLDELESSVDKEKSSRAKLEKERRKIQGDLKMTQETVSEIERSNKELEAAILRKDNEITGLASALDDEQSLVSKIQKSIKEQQGHVEELEEELEAERQARAKAERQRSDLAREMESLGERLNEASGATSAQVELNKKREAEVNKLRKDLEECNIQHDATIVRYNFNND